MNDHQGECFFCIHAKDTPPGHPYEKECEKHGYLLTDIMTYFDGSCEDFEEGNLGAAEARVNVR